MSCIGFLWEGRSEVTEGLCQGQTSSKRQVTLMAPAVQQGELFMIIYAPAKTLLQKNFKLFK